MKPNLTLYLIMKIHFKKYFASLVLAAYLSTLISASFHYHDLNINNNKLYSFEKDTFNNSHHFISQNICAIQYFLSHDFNFTHENIKSDFQLFLELELIEYFNPQLLKTYLQNICLRAPPIS